MSFYKNFGLSKPLREPNIDPGMQKELEKYKSMYSSLQTDYNKLMEESKGDSQEELKETRSKLKVITNKFATVRKERDSLKKENRELKDEIMDLQSNMRQMVPGFQNTSSSFPMWNEIGHMTEQFYKCDCQDLFFDILSIDLSMDGVIYFFRFAFSEAKEVMSRYFAPLEDQIKTVSCMTDIQGPIMNVLRKSFQSTWKSILSKCLSNMNLDSVVNVMTKELKLSSYGVKPAIKSTLSRILELTLCYYASDPPMFCEIDAIGKKISFNVLKHECLDGFVKQRQECYVLLPPVYKGSVDGELITKAAVLPTNYVF